MPGCEGLQGWRQHFQAGQRRSWASSKGVGVPGCEGPSTYETHFQAGQRRTWASTSTTPEAEAEAEAAGCLDSFLASSSVVAMATPSWGGGEAQGEGCG